MTTFIPKISRNQKNILNPNRISYAEYSLKFYVIFSYTKVLKKEKKK